MLVDVATDAPRVKKKTDIVFATEEIEALPPIFEALMKDDMIPTSVEGIAQYVEVEQRMAKLLPMFVKFKKRAAEKDKDKQLYGPETLKKVKALIEEYEKIDEAFQDHVTPKFAAAAEASEEERKAAIEAAKAAREEAISTFCFSVLY